MIDLAFHYDKSPVLLKDIAQRQKISKKYLEQLTIPLKACGLIKTVRGIKGGYVLDRPPAEIRMLEVLEALEGPLNLVRCVADANICPLSSTCVTRDIWTKLAQALSQSLSSMTLDKLIAEKISKEGSKND